MHDNRIRVVLVTNAPSSVITTAVPLTLFFFFFFFNLMILFLNLEQERSKATFVCIGPAIKAQSCFYIVMNFDLPSYD